jgi:hypothetical protein
VEKLDVLIAAIAVVILVSIWIRTSVVLARLRSLSQALASIADGLRPLTESPDHTEPADLENARRALLDAQEILAGSVGGSDGHEIEIRANMSPSGSASAQRIVERRVSEVRGGARPLAAPYRFARM